MFCSYAFLARHLKPSVRNRVRVKTLLAAGRTKPRWQLARGTVDAVMGVDFIFAEKEQNYVTTSRTRVRAL